MEGVYLCSMSSIRDSTEMTIDDTNVSAQRFDKWLYRNHMKIETKTHTYYEHKHTEKFIRQVPLVRVAIKYIHMVRFYNSLIE